MDLILIISLSVILVVDILVSNKVYKMEARISMLEQDAETIADKVYRDNRTIRGLIRCQSAGGAVTLEADSRDNKSIINNEPFIVWSCTLPEKNLETNRPNKRGGKRSNLKGLKTKKNDNKR